MTFVKVTRCATGQTEYVNLSLVQRIYGEDGSTFVEFRDEDMYADGIYVTETAEQILAQVPK